MVPPAVRAQGLRVVRGGTEILPGLHFELPAGRVIGLLGPSGAGKTTLLRSIVGVQQITDGRLEVLGAPAGSPALRTKIGYATQSAAVYDDLTVLENVRYFSAMLGAPAGDVERVVGAVDLGEYRNRLAARLSGGQRSRVSLAIAMLGTPELLVLDEPTAGLDPLLRQDLWQLFHQLTADGVSLLVSSHVMDEAERCDELLLMREGAVIARGTAAQLRQRTGTTSMDAAFLELVGSGQR